MMFPQKSSADGRRLYVSGKAKLFNEETILVTYFPDKKEEMSPTSVCWNQFTVKDLAH